MLHSQAVKNKYKRITHKPYSSADLHIWEITTLHTKQDTSSIFMLSLEIVGPYRPLISQYHFAIVLKPRTQQLFWDINSNTYFNHNITIHQILWYIPYFSCHAKSMIKHCTHCFYNHSYCHKQSYVQTDIICSDIIKHYIPSWETSESST